MKRLGLIFVMVILAACSKTESDSPAASGTDTAAPASAATSATDTAAASTSTSAVPPGDLQFATTASMANLYEIEAGRLALGKTKNPAYTRFAETMVQQHTEIGNSYKPIATAQALPMLTALEGDFKAQYDQLSAAPEGPEFDALYRQQMIATHTAARTLFQNESASGQDPELKAFAARWLSTVEHHLQMANALPQAR